MNVENNLVFSVLIVGSVPSCFPTYTNIFDEFMKEKTFGELIYINNKISQYYEIIISQLFNSSFIYYRIIELYIVKSTFCTNLKKNISRSFASMSPRLVLIMLKMLL